MEAKIKLDEKAIYLETSDEKIFWDVETFRPDPRDELKMNKIYSGKVNFSIENFFSGEEIKVPQKIKINSKIYAMVR